jgi:glyoxylase-like metal-dependent hydrolase (beta-lactamase superfamily II)
VTLDLDHVVTHGIFSLDGEDFEVDNNIWILGDDREVIVVDAAHDHRPILDAIGGRKVQALVMSHGHNDHINAAAELADATGAPILLHPDDTMLWQVVYEARRVDAPLVDGHHFTVAGDDVRVIHTPGHSPGGCCLYVPSLGTLFSGDTLFSGRAPPAGRSPTTTRSCGRSASACSPFPTPPPSHRPATRRRSAPGRRARQVIRRGGAPQSGGSHSP